MEGVKEAAFLFLAVCKQCPDDLAWPFCSRPPQVAEAKFFQSSPGLSEITLDWKTADKESYFLLSQLESPLL